MGVDPELARMFDLRFFHENGWARKQCPTCEDHFWTLDESRRLCGDSTCEEYQFLGDPLTDKPLALAQMREAFLSYWEQAPVPHTRVPRNPVVARWRDDLYLNIASIANYQPHVTSGEVPPPANPLVVSQPCIRLNDLSNIGRSGRHFSCFEMMGHHAFNSSAWGMYYWTEECVAWGHRFLTDALGLDGRRITYKESLWSGGGNAGPCFEVFAGGLEVATLVFMCLEEHEEGAFEVKGERYRMMDLKIIDTGWGLERLAWASTGTPTAYDTVFPDAIAKIRGLASVPIADDARSRKLVEMHARVQGVLNLDVGTRLDRLREEVVARMAEHGIETTAAELQEVMEPIEAMYGLCDHLRCLSFMVGDGIVPSNVKAGYLMRLVFRRAIRFAQTLGIETPLSDLLAWNLGTMLDEFPAFAAAIPRAREIAELEVERYGESRDRGLRLVERLLSKSPQLGIEELVDLYDTHGLAPQLVAEAAREKGVTVEVPDTFDAIVAERHSREKKAKTRRLVPADVPSTRRIFYEDEGQAMRSFDAQVTWVGDVVDGIQPVVLSQTCFFHDTGGQPGDHGILRRTGGKGGKGDAGSDLPVTDTTKDDDHAVHHVRVGEPPLAVGDGVHGEVDWTRRMDHTRSHTATHIVNQAVRRVLGNHSWQAGTQKYTDCARVDMTHYRRPTREEVASVERLANHVVMQGRPVLRSWWKREEAEAKWGTQLLQGGIPKGRDVRVVRIGPAPTAEDIVLPGGSAVAAAEDFDVEYCGGTHCATTGQVGPVKMFRTERIQDGVERFEYSAGLHAVDRWQHDEGILRRAAAEVDVAPAELPNAVRRFFSEWKEQRKLLQDVQAQLAQLKSEAAAAGAETIDGVRLVVDPDVPPGVLQQAAKDLTGDGSTIALLGARGDKPRIVFARSADVDVDMGALLRDTIGIIGGRGGGRPDMAQGGGADEGKLAECLEVAAKQVRAALS